MVLALPTSKLSAILAPSKSNWIDSDSGGSPRREADAQVTAVIFNNIILTKS